MFDHEILDFVVQHCNPQTNQLSGAAGGPEPCLARCSPGPLHCDRSRVHNNADGKISRELALAAYERAVDRTRVSPFVRRCARGDTVSNTANEAPMRVFPRGVAYY